MQNDYITKVGKILSRQKNPDRHTLVSIFKPKEEEEKNHGVLYFIIEILSSDPAMARVAKLIESTVIDEYYQEIGDGLNSLESALKRVNEELAVLADEGEVGWIGKVNGVIAALEGDVLHITQSGTVETYLVRSNNITHITEGLSSAADKPNPLKTFVNIASGDLEMGDRVIISSSELFYHFSLDDLRRIISKFSPAAAATYIVKSLKREEVESINALILELASEDSLEENERPDETEWIGEQAGLEKYAEYITPVAKILLNFSKKGLEKSKEIYDESISPGITKFSKEASKKVGEKVAEFSQKKGANGETNFWNKDNKILEDDSVPQQNLFEAPKKTIVTGATNTIKSSIETGKTFVSKSKERSQFFAIASIFLIVIVVVSGFYSYQSRKTTARRTEITQKYESIKTKTEGAVKAKELGDEKKARSLLTEAQKSIEELSSYKYLSSEIAALSIQIDQEIEKMFNIQRLSDLAPIADFSTIDETIKLEGLAKFGNTLVSTDRERKNMVVYPLDSTPQQLSSVYFNGAVTDIVDTDNPDAIYFTTKDPNSVYTYINSTQQIISDSQITGESWPLSSSIDTYLGKIYLLVPGDNQIYKYAPAGNGYGTRGNYINDNTGLDLSDAVDISIDSSLYLLKSNGEVWHFLSGDKLNFELSGMPALTDKTNPDNTSATDLLDPIKIIANEDVDNIYIADRGAKRIVVFDKDGYYQTQYISDSFTDIRDVVVSKEDGKIYVLSGTKVFEINL